MLAVVQALLSLVAMISPGASTGIIAQIIEALVTIIPVIVKEAKDLAPPVKNIIAALRGSEQITPEQLDQLDALELELDADFDDAADKATAEDIAASTGKP